MNPRDEGKAQRRMPTALMMPPDMATIRQPYRLHR